MSMLEHHGCIDVPSFGTLQLSWNFRGIYKICWLYKKQTTSWNTQYFQKVPDFFKDILLSYFRGESVRLHEQLPYFLLGTSFQIHVWNALTTIAFGQVKTYLDIARQIRNPNAARAVGQANANNRLPLIIPCHRVILSNRCIGGYRYGSTMKKNSFKLRGSADNIVY